jgi:hypothetical protein
MIPSDRNMLRRIGPILGLEVPIADHCWVNGGPVCRTRDKRSVIWNPLDSNGDALKLAVRFSMTVAVECDGKTVAAVFHGGKVAQESFADPAGAEVATRRAIVRCAVLAADVLDDERNRQHLGITPHGMTGTQAPTGEVEFTPDEAKAGRARRGDTLHYCCYGMYCDAGHDSGCQFALGVGGDANG